MMMVMLVVVVVMVVMIIMVLMVMESLAGHLTLYCFKPLTCINLSR